MLNNKSIIFFDIDGTLLNEDKKLPVNTKKSIYALQELGHEVAIATGRAPFMYENLRKELNIHTFVSYNGQYVVYQDEVIYKNPLNKENLEKLTDISLLNNHPIVYMDHEDMKANVANHHFIIESIGTLQIEQFPTLEPTYYKEREIYQSLLFCQRSEEKEYEHAINGFDFVRWHPLSVDVIPRGGSKAKGIEKIIEKIDIPNERIYAFGDGLNDLEMLSTVHNSVAMGNGHIEAKKAAKYLTKSVDEDGIMYGLKLMGLL